MKLPRFALLQRVLDLLRRRAERRARFGADLRHAHHHLALRRIAVRLDDRVLAAARDSCWSSAARTCSTDGAWSNCTITDGAAGELDALRDALGADHDDAGEDDDPRQGDGVPAPAQEVVSWCS